MRKSFGRKIFCTAISAVLAFGQLFAAIPSGISAMAADDDTETGTWKATTLVTNGDFETGNYDGWTLNENGPS